MPSRVPRRISVTHGVPSLFAALCALLAVSLPISLSCEPVLAVRVVAEQLAAPVFATGAAGSSRVYLVERAGTIRILQSGVVFATPFLDIRSRVGLEGEGGLLGVAFPTSFTTSGHFYVFYSDTAGASVLSRFVRSAANPGQADPSSEKRLLSFTPPTDHHKGGTIAFSPIDGFLYLGIGDGDDPEAVRDPSSLLGKMLRLDVSGGANASYAIPPDNPFAGPDAVRDEIWAFGLRNPFRFSFDRVTGDLWIGDVGAAQREEIDFEEAGSGGGRDYGWPTHEGTTCHAPEAQDPCEDPSNPSRYTFPVYEYAHDEGCSITGGVVSRGGTAFLAGNYVFADFCSGRIWMLVDGHRVDITGSMQPGGFGLGVVGISEDAAGSLYLSQMSTGRVYRIE